MSDDNRMSRLVLYLYFAKVIIKITKIKIDQEGQQPLPGHDTQDQDLACQPKVIVKIVQMKNVEIEPDPEGQHCHRLPPPRGRESQGLQLCS